MSARDCLREEAYRALRCTASDQEALRLPNDTVVTVHKWKTAFEVAAVSDKADTYGGKALLAWNGETVYAELAILRALTSVGYNGVWVDSFGHGAFRENMRDVPAVELPNPQAALYRSISARSPMRGGCWDVFAWRDDSVLFVESKRRQRDRLRPNQLSWLKSGLEVGISADSFVCLEWELAHAP